MTYENTLPTMEFLDDVFGTPNLFTFTHEFFNQAKMYLSSRYHLDDRWQAGHPDPENLRLHNRNGHKVGVEGLRQKGWTLFTIFLIMAVAQILGVRAELTGQGDNQTIKLWVQLPEGVTPDMAEKF